MKLTKDPVLASLDSARWYDDAHRVTEKARELPQWFLRAGQLALEKVGPHEHVRKVQVWMTDSHSRVAPFGIIEAIKKAIEITMDGTNILVCYSENRDQTVSVARSILADYDAIPPAWVYSATAAELLSGPDDTHDGD